MPSRESLGLGRRRDRLAKSLEDPGEPLTVLTEPLVCLLFELLKPAPENRKQHRHALLGEDARGVMSPLRPAFEVAIRDLNAAALLVVPNPESDWPFWARRRSDQLMKSFEDLGQLLVVLVEPSGHLAFKAL